MKVRGWPVLAALAVFCPPARANVVRDDEKTFAVQPGAKVRVDLYKGAVEVVEDEDPSRVRVEVHLDAPVDREDEAERLFERLELTTESKNNEVVVAARNPSEERAHWSWDDARAIGLAVKIHVPSRCDADLSTRGGSIDVGNLAGRVLARTDYGRISIRNVDGSIDARSKYKGTVIVSRCSGPVYLQTGAGTVRAGTIGGYATLLNDGGDVEIQTARGGAMASAVKGDVTIGVPYDLSGEIRAWTSYGSIYANIDPKANCTIDASARGKIRNMPPRRRSDPPQLVFQNETWNRDRSRLNAQLNQGGNPLVFYANGGDVELKSAETAFER